jgi:hypothetical protein
MFSKKKKNEISSYRNKAFDLKRRVSAIFIVLLIAQVIVFNNVNIVVKNMLSRSVELKSIKVKFETLLVQETIRGQQRRMLNAVRSGWVSYVEDIPIDERKLILKDSTGKYIYSNSQGSRISFDPEKMEQILRIDKFYDIKDKQTGELLASAVRPQWNPENVKKILGIVAAPMKAFGAAGDVIIYDAYTGEMIVDNSEDCKDTPQVLGKDGKRYITLDYLHPANANPAASKRVVDKEFMWRKDTDTTSGQVYYFSEPIDMKEDANNFEKYPLGEYKREFQEKIILPYETIGVEGQPMQIAVVSGAQEQEIVSVYKLALKDYALYEEHLISHINSNMLAPMLSALISLITILIAIYAIKRQWYFYTTIQCPKLCEGRLCERDDTIHKK